MAIIHVGQDPKAPFCAYGDESQVGDLLVYAFVFVRRRHARRARRVVKKLRRDYGIPEDCPIHCRVLYSGHQREKACLGHLDSGDADALVTRLIKSLKDVPLMCRYTHHTLPARDPLVEIEGDLPSLPREPKGVLGTLMGCCFLVKPDGSQGPTVDQTEVFVSADPTKIRFLHGKKRYQAHKGYSGFSAVGAPKGHNYRVEPHVVPSAQWHKHPLLQVADVHGYVAARALAPNPRQDFFRSLRDQMTYVSNVFVFTKEKAVMQPGPG